MHTHTHYCTAYQPVTLFWIGFEKILPDTKHGIEHIYFVVAVVAVYFY